jgi:hypothetical protein
VIREPYLPGLRPWPLELLPKLKSICMATYFGCDNIVWLGSANLIKDKKFLERCACPLSQGLRPGEGGCAGWPLPLRVHALFLLARSPNQAADRAKMIWPVRTLGMRSDTAPGRGAPAAARPAQVSEDVTVGLVPRLADHDRARGQRAP